MSDVRITELDVRILEGDPRPWMFVQIHTDAGVTGIGEIPRTRHSWRLVEQSGDNRSLGHFTDDVDRLGRLLIGEDPFHTERLFGVDGKLGAAPNNLLLTSIIGGFDIACWDIKGKLLDVPVHELLGGKVREAVRLYANGWGHHARTIPQRAGGGDREDAINEVIEVLSRSAKEVVEAGYSACKFSPFQWGEPMKHSGRDLRAAIEVIESIHDLVAPDIDLFIDGHRKLSVPEAQRVCRQLEALDLGFFEEPVSPEVTPLRRISECTSIPIATGELLFTHRAFAGVLAETGVSVLQPDVAWAGGITELWKVAAMASSNGVGFAPHNAGGPVLTHAAIHVDAVSPAFMIQESFEEFYHPDWTEDLVLNPLSIEGGEAVVPDRPGLGIELDETVLRDHEVVT